MRKLGYRPELDGLRGVAVLLVVASHVTLFTPYGIGRAWRGGALGVDLFFVLSGFLITSLLLTEWGQNGRVSLRAFYARRARRLLPALVVVVAFFGLVSVIEGRTDGSSALLYAGLQLSYFANVVVASGHQVGLGFTHLWSLAQEEQFYLLWPLVLVVLFRRKADPRVLLMVLAAGIAISNAQRVTAAFGDESWSRTWYGPDTHADAILLGCAAGVVYVHRLAQVPPRVGLAALAVAGATVAWSDPHHPHAAVIALPVFAAAATLLLLAAVDSPSWTATRVLSAKPLRTVGWVSYGLYLWHFPMLAYFGLAGMPAAVAATVLSYWLVEQPLRRPRRSRARYGLPVGRTAAGVLATPRGSAEISH